MKDIGEPTRRERKPMTEIARRLRQEPTPAGARLWAVVRRKQCGGLRFLRQHDVGHFVLDFYYASAQVAVEVDGAIHNNAEVAANDREREAVLRDELGIRFVRLSDDFVLTASEAEIRNDLRQKILPALAFRT